MQFVVNEVRKIVGENAGHGMAHIFAVLENAKNMIEANRELSYVQNTIIMLAALLHDVDDHKFFEGTSNAKNILERSEFAELSEEIIFCIDCVGYSTNQNTFPKTVPAKFDRYGFNRAYFNEHGVFADPDMWILYPRFADRLEAMDIERALEFGRSRGRADYNDQTPRIFCNGDFDRINFAERFEQYIANGCRAPTSRDTSIDHIYDKCMNLVNMQTKNKWCETEKLLRHENMRQDIIIFWKRENAKVMLPTDRIPKPSPTF